MQSVRRANLWNRQRQLRDTDGASLSTMNCLVAIPENYRFQNDIELDQPNSSGLRIAVRKSANSAIRAFYLALLHLCLETDATQAVLDIELSLKQLLYSCQIPFHYLASVLHHPSMSLLSRSNIINRLLMDFVQKLEHRGNTPIVDFLLQMPIIDLCLLIVVRSAMFNQLQNISLLQLQQDVQLDELLNFFKEKMGLKVEKHGYCQFVIGHRISITETQQKMVISKWQPEQLRLKSHYSAVEQKRIAINDARNVISEESFPTESDAESDVVFKLDMPRQNDFFQTEDQMRSTPTTAHTQSESPTKMSKPPLQENFIPSRIQTAYGHTSNSSSKYHDPVSPVPMNFNIKNNFTMGSCRNNSLFENNKAAVHRHDESHDSKGRRVSYSKERLSAKKKPDLSIHQHREAINIGEERMKIGSTGELPPPPSYYNGGMNVGFSYSNPIGVLKSNSQKKQTKPAVSEQEEPQAKRYGRRPPSYQRAKLAVESRRRNK